MNWGSWEGRKLSFWKGQQNLKCIYYTTHNCSFSVSHKAYSSTCAHRAMCTPPPLLCYGLSQREAQLWMYVRGWARGERGWQKVKMLILPLETIKFSSCASSSQGALMRESRCCHGNQIMSYVKNKCHIALFFIFNQRGTLTYLGFWLILQRHRRPGNIRTQSLCWPEG